MVYAREIRRSPAASQPFSPLSGLLALILVLAATAGVAAESKTLRTAASPAEALKVADEIDGLVLIEFETSWCGWCRRLEREVLATPEFAKEAGALVLVKIDAEKQRELAQSYEARSYPLLVVMDAEARVQAYLNGYVGRDALVSLLREIREGKSERTRLEQAAVQDDSQAQGRLAAFLLRGSEHEEALPWLELRQRALWDRLIARPDHAATEQAYAGTLLLLAKAQAGIGNPDVAREHLKELLLLEPTRSDRKRADVLLARLASSNRAAY